MEMHSLRKSTRSAKKQKRAAGSRRRLQESICTPVGEKAPSLAEQRCSIN